MGESLSLDECNRLWLLLSETRAAIYKARMKRAGRFLHPNWVTALIVIWAFDEQTTPSLLSRHLFLERHSVSELISRLHKKGLVKKSKDAKRKNMVRISLTKKGREVCRLAMQQDFISDIMSSLSDDQREQLRTSLRILFDRALDELGIKSEMLIKIM